MAAWIPCGYGYYIFPNQVQTQVNFIQSQDSDSSRIELPGGGFITRPGSDVMPSPVAQLDAFATPQERQTLMNELDKLMEDRATREKTLQDMVSEEDSLKKSLSEVNEALDVQTVELEQLTETMRTNRIKMQARIQEKKARLAELKEVYSSVEEEERQNASYRKVANQSRYLRRRISKQNDEKEVLKKKVDDLLEKKEVAKIRCKMIDDEERTFWLRISEKVQWMAENGYRLDVGRPTETGSEIDAENTSTKDDPPQTSPSSSPTKPTDCEISNKGEIDAAERTECAEDIQMELPRGDLKESGASSAQSVETCVEVAKPETGNYPELKAHNTSITDEQYQTSPSNNPTKPTDSEIRNREEIDAADRTECTEGIQKELPGGDLKESGASSAQSVETCVEEAAAGRTECTDGIVYCDTLRMEVLGEDSADSSTSTSSAQSVATCVEIARTETDSESKEEYTDIKDDQPQTSPSSVKLTDNEASNREEIDGAKRTDYTKGILYSESLRYELPGGVWTESCSINSTSTESLETEKTEITVKVDVHEPPKSPKSRNQLRKKLRSHSHPLHLSNSQEQLAVKIERIEFEAEDQAVEESHKKGGIFGCFKVLRRLFKLGKRSRGNWRKSARKL